MGCTGSRAVVTRDAPENAKVGRTDSGSPGVSAATVVPSPSRKTPADLKRYGVTRRTISTSRLRRGFKVSEFYDLEETILGTGISGAVRIATHKESGRTYAIKTLSLEGVNETKLAMFYNEVAVYLQLDHPNIAKLVEAYEDSEAIHIVMELCSGRELYDRLASKKRYSERDAARVARQMDLKLENWVYMDNSLDSPLKLIDFGFSRIFNPSIPMTAMHGTVYYISPEVMDGCYGEKCDIWSIGVIVYMLLSGSPPFNGKHDHDILINIKRASFKLDGPRWNDISDEAKDFVSSLIVKDPESRPSAADCLAHIWLNDNAAQDIELPHQVVHGLREFALSNAMKRAAIALIAYSGDLRDLHALEKQFEYLDVSNTGTITYNDLATMLIGQLHISEEEAIGIFTKLDQTGDQELHFSEFLAASLHHKILQEDSLIQQAFSKFDVDRTGYITADNLRHILGDVYDGMRVEDIVATCDSDGDLRISFEEFISAVLSEVRNDVYDSGRLVGAISHSIMEFGGVTY
eukprot:GHVO01051190.1.p1 GENE.GHVO01051190.1~~GHVO01051190.1.p1  ORF type:complete len:520 (-),score=53.01 GHVO01051190.1:399-1958(-)